MFTSTNAPTLVLAIIMCFFVTACQSEHDKKIELGQQVVKDNCKICHAQGINGAPIIGNKKMWSKRLAQSDEILIQHATNGFGLMPAKGGKSHLRSDQISAAVAYMRHRAETP